LVLTDHTPFPWQQALFNEFTQKEFRKTCDVPTGLGKTSIIAIRLLALVNQARADALKDFPRRLIYVVNRRTVVDQATRETEHIRQTLLTKPELNQPAPSLHLRTSERTARSVLPS
jgi:CRISPR-associated endonuclease/helicase Cas3